MPNDDNETLENVRIVFRNFSGKEDRYNRAGDRNFSVLLPDDIAEYFAKRGWNVKTLKPREEGDPEQAYMPVKVKYGKGRPPRVVMITSRGRTYLDEDTINLLDWADIENIDLILRPFDWKQPNGDSGRTAYLQSIYVTIREDELELKYADLDEIPARAGRTDEEPPF